MCSTGAADIHGSGGGVGGGDDDEEDEYISAIDDAAAAAASSSTTGGDSVLEEEEEEEDFSDVPAVNDSYLRDELSVEASIKVSIWFKISYLLSIPIVPTAAIDIQRYIFYYHMQYVVQYSIYVV